MNIKRFLRNAAAVIIAAAFTITPVQELSLLPDISASAAVSSYTVTFPENVTVTRSNKSLTSGTKVSAGDALTIKATAPTGYRLKSLKVNGNPFTSGRTYTVVNSNVTITAEFARATAGGYVSAIGISTTPYKTVYSIGETFNAAGGKLAVYYSNGDVEHIDLSNAEITGFDSKTAGSKKLTVTYEGQTVNLTVTVSKTTSDNTANHTHSYGSWKTIKEATCTAEGYRERVCRTCGYYEYETTNVFDHSFITEKVSATYTRQGYTSYECKYCGYEYEDSYTDKIDISKDADLEGTEITSSSVTLSWNELENVDGYRIQQLKGKKWKYIETIDDPEETEFTVKGLDEDTKYEFRIRAYVLNKNDRRIYSDYSKSITVETLEKSEKDNKDDKNDKEDDNDKTGITLADLTVENLTAIGTLEDGVRLVWNKCADADAYEIEYYNGSGWTLIGKTRSGNVGSCALMGLKAGKNYSFRVRAYADVSGGTLYGDYDSVEIMTLY